MEKKMNPIERSVKIKLSFDQIRFLAEQFAATLPEFKDCDDILAYAELDCDEQMTGEVFVEGILPNKK